MHFPFDSLTLHREKGLSYPFTYYLYPHREYTIILKQLFYRSFLTNIIQGLF